MAMIPFVKKRNADAVKIVSMFPKKEDYGQYIDPYVGFGDILLNLRPTRAIISDPDPDIVNVWRSIKDFPERFIKELLLLKNTNVNHLLKYLSKNKRRTVRRAAYFLTLQVGINAVLNKSNMDKIRRMSEYMAKNSISVVYAKDPMKIIKMAKKNDLVYLDSTRDNDKSISTLVRKLPDKKFRVFIADDGDIQRHGIDFRKYKLKKLPSKHYKVVVFK